MRGSCSRSCTFSTGLLRVAAIEECTKMLAHLDAMRGPWGEPGATIPHCGKPVKGGIKVLFELRGKLKEMKQLARVGPTTPSAEAKGVAALQEQVVELRQLLQQQQPQQPQ